MGPEFASQQGNTAHKLMEEGAETALRGLQMRMEETADMLERTTESQEERNADRSLMKTLILL